MSPFGRAATCFEQRFLEGRQRPTSLFPEHGKQGDDGGFSIAQRLRQFRDDIGQPNGSETEQESRPVFLLILALRIAETIEHHRCKIPRGRTEPRDGRRRRPTYLRIRVEQALSQYLKRLVNDEAPAHELFGGTDPNPRVVVL